MGKTYRKKGGYKPEGGFNTEREKHRYHGDSYNHDGDANPPKWFKETEQRAFRRKQRMQLDDASYDYDAVIETNYKMPYYT